MYSDPDRLLSRLVVAALTIFGVVTLVVAAFVAREIWLQQRMADLNSSLETNLETLQETTEEIQDQMSELRTTADELSTSAELDDVTELLEDVDQQLEALEGEIDESGMIQETGIDPAATAVEDAPVELGRRQADQVFTIFAILVGIAAVAIALLLGMAMRVQSRKLAP